MERNKSDKTVYALAGGGFSKGQPSLSKNKQEEGTRQLKDSMFVKYASSIIQVLSQQRLEIMAQKGNEYRQHTPLVEVSEVMRYGEESRVRSDDYQLNLQNNYNLQPLRNRPAPSHTLRYSFSNLTTLYKALVTLTRNTNMRTLQTIRNSIPKKRQVIPLIKTRSSLHSGTSTSTFTEELRSCKQLQSLKMIEMSEQRREGANAVKGWLQFKILMIENTVLRQLQSLSNFIDARVLSPISASSQEMLIDNFCLSEYQRDNSIDLSPSVPHGLGESLAYTADINFQFSRKENTLTTPDKLSRGQGINYHSPQSANLIANCKYSQVQEYKQHLKKDSKASSQVRKGEDNRRVSIDRPVRLCASEERRYLTIRTNLFQLPLLPDIDLRVNTVGRPGELPGKVDRISPEQHELYCDNVQSIVEELESAFFLVEKGKSNKNSYDSNLSNKTGTNSYFTSIRQKYSKVGFEQNKNSGKVTQTCKLQTKLSPNHHAQTASKLITSGLTSTQRKAPHKVDDYYFPGREPKQTYKQPQGQVRSSKELDNGYSQRKRLDQVKQVDSIFGEHRTGEYQNKEFSKGGSATRIDESIVCRISVDEPKLNSLRENVFPKKTEWTPTHQPMPESSKLREKRSTESRQGFEIRMKTKMAVPEGQNRRYQQSPNNFNNLKHYNPNPTLKLQQPMHSPSSHNTNPYSPSPNHLPYDSKLSQQYTSPKRQQNLPRPESRQKHVQKIGFNHTESNQSQNIYQLNHNSYGAVDRRQQLITGITFSQENRVHGQMIQPARPVSRVFSPQTGPAPPNHLNPHFANADRQHCQRKIVYFSPQMKLDHYHIQSPVNFVHKAKLNQEMTSGIAEPGHEYFNVEPRQRNSQANSIAFNNKYYTSWVVGRQPPIMAGLQRQPARPNPQVHFTDRNQSSARQLDRPHSSYKQQFERLNIFSNFSPHESNLDPHNGSNAWSSRPASRGARPKSMNEKIFLTRVGRNDFPLI